jgi:hypothetical protein
VVRHTADRIGHHGFARSPRRRSALEFSEYRPHRPGDDPRRLDWKLLARSDRAYVRLTDDPAPLPTMVIWNASASMVFLTSPRAKWRPAVSLDIGLAATATAGDSLWLKVSTSGGILQSPPATHPGIIGELAEMRVAVTPRGRASVAAAFRPGHAVKGCIVVISDFLEETNELNESDCQARSVALLDAIRAGIATGAEFHAVHAMAGDELEPPHRALRLRDPQYSTICRSLTRSVRVRYVARFTSRRHTVRYHWCADGGHYHVATTPEPALLLTRPIVSQ